MSILRKLVKSFFSVKLFKPLLKDKIFIFCYHDISDENQFQHSQYYSTTVSAFKEQIEFIKENFEIIAIDKLCQQEELKRGVSYAVITFDDGFESVIQNAYPFLKLQNIPFTVFINKCAVLHNQIWFSDLVLHAGDRDFLEKFYNQYFNLKKEDVKTKFINGDLMQAVLHVNFDDFNIEKIEYTAKVYADLEQLKLWKENEALLTYGNHTENHYNLGNCSIEIQHSEIMQNQLFIQQLQSSEKIYLAFPFGKKQHYTKQLLNWLKKNKILCFTTNPTYLALNKDYFEDAIPRIPIAKQSLKEIIFMINRTLLKKIDL